VPTSLCVTAATICSTGNRAFLPLERPLVCALWTVQVNACQRITSCVDRIPGETSSNAGGHTRGRGRTRRAPARVGSQNGGDGEPRRAEDELELVRPGGLAGERGEPG